MGLHRVQFHIAMVASGDFSHDGQAQAHAAGLVAAAHEALEHALAHGFGQADAVVLHLGHGQTVLRAGAQRHAQCLTGGCWPGVAQCVVEQIAQGLAQQHGIALHL